MTAHNGNPGEPDLATMNALVNNDGSLTRTGRQFADRCGEVIDGMARAAAVDALARALHAVTDGVNREGTQGWPERHRDVYALAVDEVADALLSSEKFALVSQAMLDALVANGTLTAQVNGRWTWYQGALEVQP